MSTDLDAFLRDRLDEDDQAARAASGDQWSLQDHPSDTVAIYDSHREPVVYHEGAPSTGQMRHIARHDPARVLAEVDAKRRIIDLHDELDREYQRDRYDESTSGQLSGVRFAIRLLALPYADHPDYRPEWAPDA